MKKIIDYDHVYEFDEKSIIENAHVQKGSMKGEKKEAR